METPLVSVICLCYNHRRFVEEAIRSVLQQTYPNVELIVVDDASTDGSASCIAALAETNTHFHFIPLQHNIGNCRAFNVGLAASQGQFVIDLAADDLLMPERIARGIEVLDAKGMACGVNFCDAELIDEQGNHLGFHADKYPHDTIPQGNMYSALIERYFICSPTMMIRREVLDQLGGYDETLAYEDFDFWIRASRSFEFVYTAETLVKRRRVSHSMSKTQFLRGSEQLRTTLQVCKKIRQLNRTAEEKGALRRRLWYEVRLAARLGEWSLAADYLKLLWQNA